MPTQQLLMLASLVLLALAALLVAGLVFYGQQRKERSDQVLDKALARHASTSEAVSGAAQDYGMEQLAQHWLTSSVGKAFVADEDRAVLAQCGWLTARAQWLFLLARCGLSLLLPLLVLLLWGGGQLMLALVFALGIGFMLPKWLLRRVAARRRAQVVQELPLLVDLLRLLQGTGMSLDQTLQVVASDFVTVMPVLSQEVAIANQQYAHGRSRERSFGRLSDLYHNDNLVNLTALLQQIDQYGGAVQEPLRIFSERLREQRKAQMKEVIGKISVKMTAVMVVTLLPSLVIVTAGPGFLAVIRALGAMSR